MVQDKDRARLALARDAGVLERLENVSRTLSSGPTRYLLALPLVGLAALARWLANDLLAKSAPLAPFLLAILLTSVFGGFGPGLLATALSALFLLLSLNSAQGFSISSPDERVQLAVLCALGACFAWVGWRERRNRARLAAWAEEARTSATARIKAEESKAFNEGVYRAIGESIDFGIWVTDAQGRNVYASPSLLELVGITQADCAGFNWGAVLHPDDRAATIAAWKECVTTGSSWERQHRYLGKDGKYHHILARGVPMRDAEGKLSAWAGINLDIRAFKEVEDALQLAKNERQELLENERVARANAERASRTKDEFLATLSHELRTPLNAILGWTHLLRKNMSNAENVREAVDVIERNARMQTQLIADLLDMSRITSGKMRLEVQPVELPAVIEGALASLRPAAEAKGIRVQSIIEPITEPVQGDSARLQQIVWNLLSNAIKFTRRGGRVQVVLARVNSHVEISVSDSGIGIRPDFLPHLFERFRQADSSSTREYTGLGIGLALVKHLTELHGGSVRVASPGVDQGATFVVELPLAILDVRDVGERRHPRALSETESPRVTISLRGLRLLVVDDEPDALQLVKRLLETHGAEIVSVSDADQALDQLSRSSFDVLLSDIGMPRRDGFELIGEVRRRGYKLPAAALTAFARAEDRTRALFSGFQAHITKPVEPSELLATVGALVGRIGA